MPEARKMRSSDIEAVYETAAMALAFEPEGRERVLSRTEEEVADRYEQPDGPICVKGAPGPLHPYLPSGAYL